MHLPEAKYIRFVGPAPRDQIVTLLRLCPAFALPSRREGGLPVAVLEAMRMGRPVVATATGGIAAEVKATSADFLACGAQKWLLSPGGTDFLHVRKELCIQ